MKIGQVLKTAAGQAARSGAGAGPHPEPDTLLGYARGEIEGEAKEALQEHLSRCADCAGAILDLRAFPYNQPAADEDLSDREIDEQWLRLVGRERRPRLGGKNLPPPSRGRSGLFGYGLAATFLVALVGLSTWTIDLQNRVADLSQPRVNVFVAQMPYGGSRGPAPRPQISSGAKYVRFELPVADVMAYEAYRISIRDGEGREVIGNSEIRRGPLGNFTIEVESGQLPVGEGSIRVFGSMGDEESTLGEYTFSKLPR